MASATSTLSYVGKLVVRDGSAAAVVIPALSMSFRKNRVVRPLSYAMGIHEPSGYAIGNSNPLISVRTHAYTPYFNATTINKWLGLPASDATNRPDASGLIPDLGKITYQFGGNTPKAWASSKLDSMIIRWGDSGEPIDLVLNFRPFGQRLAFGSADATAAGSSEYGQPFLGAGLVYSTTGSPQFNYVHAGAVAFNNNLYPDHSTPAPAANAAGSGEAAGSTVDTCIYPKQYFNGMINFGVTLTQDRNEDAGNPTVNPESTAAPSALVFGFKNPGWTTGSPASGVKFTLYALSPDEAEDTDMTVALVDRSYSNTRTSAASSAVVAAMASGDA